MSELERIRACEVRIDGLEDGIKRIEGKLDTITTNHLPHIEARISHIDRRLAWILGGFAVVMALVKLAPAVISLLK